MKVIVANWFECKIQYEKVMEDGLQKKVVEQYVVNALSYAEAEARITEELKCYVSGEFEVKDLKKAAFKEVAFSEDPSADRYYRAKLDFILLDEKTEREKRSRVQYLVQAKSLRDAMKNVEEMMGGTMINFETCAVEETKFLDVFADDTRRKEPEG